MKGMSALLALCVAIGGCARSNQDKADDAIIEDLRSGALIRALSAEVDSGAPELEGIAETRAVAVEQEPQEPTATRVSAAPVCTEVPVDPAAGAPRFAAYTSLIDCFRELLTEVRVWDLAAERFRTQMFRDDLLSSHSLAALPLFVKALASGTELRREFLPSEHDELQAIYAKRRVAYAGVESKIFEVLTKHQVWLDTLSIPSARGYLALLRTRGDTARRVTELSSAYGIRLSKEMTPFVPVELLSPYGVALLLPEKGNELSRTVVVGQTPFDSLVNYAVLLEGPSNVVKQTRASYEAMRALDGPTVDVGALGTQVKAVAGAVQVAFMDSGLDYRKFPALGRYLSVSSGGFTSADYADGDANPWEPTGTGSVLGHGSGTAATTLTVLSDLEPGILRGGNLKLASWKVFSNRVVLAGPFAASQKYGRMWENREAPAIDALVEQLSKPRADQPHAVSVSMTFAGWSVLSTRAPDLLAQSRPLFVMAAGNQSSRLDKAPSPGCFADVPKDKKPGDRILCVGALKQGITQDDMVSASYTNYGESVDVYTRESFFTDMCVNGTSCATPAITASVAAIFATVPELGAAEVRRAVIETAEEREVPTELPLVRDASGRVVPEVRKIRYFNPLTMHTRLIETAKKIKAEKIAKAESMLASGG